MPSKIEYCDETLEVTGGCMKCSPGCQNCWAIKEVWRMAHNPLLGEKWKGLVEKKNGVLNWTGKIKCFEEALEKLRKKPTRYFIDSKSDLFHPKVPFVYIDKVCGIGYDYPQHTLLFLTKRIRRAAEFWQTAIKFHRIPPNVHLGVSISTPDEMGKATELSRIPAAVRFISFEPLLADVGQIPLQNIGGVIVGGESGPGARPMHPDWPRNIRDQCVAANVPFYFKQWGEYGVYGPNKHFDVLHWRTKRITDAYKKLYKMPTVGKVELIKRNIKVVCVTLKGEIVDDGGWPYGAVEMGRITKKKAGCILDGKEWKQLPAPAALERDQRS